MCMGMYNVFHKHSMNCLSEQELLSGKMVIPADSSISEVMLRM